MEARGGGSIVTLTYLGSTRVFPNYNVMGVAKAALEATVRYLAADLGPQNIRVNADLRRARSRRSPRPASAASRTSSASSASARRSGARSKRAKSPTPRCFCSSEAGRGVTGEVLMVDAGYHMVGM